MQASATAGIEFDGATMRYSEVEHYGNRCRLLRLGDCDFEFNASRVLDGPGDAVHVQTISDALAEIFLGTTARTFRLAVHHPGDRNYTVLAENGEADDAVRVRAAEELELLFGARAGTDRRVMPAASPVFPDMEDVSAVHAAELQETFAERLSVVTSGINSDAVEPISYSVAIARIIKGLSVKGTGLPGRVLSLGLYGNRTEYTLTRAGEIVFTQTRTETAPGDVAYFALYVLHLIGSVPPSDMAVRLYGTTISDDIHQVLQEHFGERVRGLNPIPIVDLENEQFDERFQFESFAVCLGAAL